MTLATDLVRLDVEEFAADADLTVNLTGAVTQTLDIITTAFTAVDTLTINASNNVILEDALIDEALVINGEGTVEITDTNPTTAAATSTITVDAKGAITLTDTDSAGDISLITTTGDLAVGTASRNAVTGEQNLTATTAAGDATVTAVNVDGILTVSAAGDAGALGGGVVKDGDITITAADTAKTIVLTASGKADITTADVAETVTISAGQDSSIDDIEDAETLNLTSSAATDAATAATVVFTLEATSFEEMNNINLNGSNNITLAIADIADIVTANADTGNNTTAAALIVTDNTSATSTVAITGNLANATTLDLSALAVDNIQIATAQLDADTTVDEVFKVASGANVEITATQVDAGGVADGAADDAHLEFTAAAVAGNTMTLTINDDSTASDTTALDLESLKVTSIATVNYVLNDTEDAVQMETINVGTASDIVVTGAGDLTVATSVVAKNFNASASTGDMDIAIIDNATIYTTGSGNDIFTFSAAPAADDADVYTIDGGAGADKIEILDTANYKGNTISFANVETIALVSDSDNDEATFTGAQMNGQSFIFLGNVGDADVFHITDYTDIGATINLSATSVVNATLELNGGDGGDILTGSATTATTINGGLGDDTIVGSDSTTGDTLNGGAGDDNITAGCGNDVIDAGTGADTINVADALVCADTIHFDVVDEGSAASATGSFTGYDVITGFETTEDKIDVVGITAAATEFEALLSTAGSTDDIDLADADFADVAKVVTFLEDAHSIVDNGGADDYVVSVSFSDFTAIYAITDAATFDTITAGEVTLLGTVDDVLVAGDFTVA